MDRLVVGVVIGPTAVALVEIANQVQNGVGAALSASSYTVTSANQRVWNAFRCIPQRKF